MAEKVSGRWQETFRPAQSYRGEGMEMIVTRKGVEVLGWYDSGYGGLEPLALTWAEIDAARARVAQGVQTAKVE